MQIIDEVIGCIISDKHSSDIVYISVDKRIVL